MKNQFKFLFFSIIIFSQLFISCGGEKQKLIKQFSAELELDLSDCKVVSEYNDYGFSLNGDGSAFLALDCKNSNVLEAIKSKNSWSQFPLSPEAEIFAYNFDSEGKNFPEIKTGYYTLIDRQKVSPENILERHSFNLTLCIYDCDKNMLYLWRPDT